MTCQRSEHSWSGSQRFCAPCCIHCFRRTCISHRTSTSLRWHSPSEISTTFRRSSPSLYAIRCRPTRRRRPSPCTTWSTAECSDRTWRRTGTARLSLRPCRLTPPLCRRSNLLLSFLRKQKLAKIRTYCISQLYMWSTWFSSYFFLCMEQNAYYFTATLHKATN